jgi:hypothetical protein
MHAAVVPGAIVRIVDISAGILIFPGLVFVQICS